VAYAVRTEVFEGPFDVLLRLITEQRVELYDVRLSDIVDAFLAEIEQLERVDLEAASEFLLIAAVLLELKSRRLLPDRDGAVKEEDLALLEERDYLLARLVECTTFSAAGRRLAELELTASRSYPRISGPDERFAGLVPDLMAGVTPADVRAAAERAMAVRPQPVIDVEHVLVDEVTVAEVVHRLLEVLPLRPRLTFRELTLHAATCNEVVVHFLGLLELYKEGFVDLEQAVTFGELLVTWTGGLDEEPEGGVLDGLVAAAHQGNGFSRLGGADLEYSG
jgi:segregation and condensation protein A